MGNNQSTAAPTSPVDVVRRPPSRPDAPPSARPLSELGPRGPSYYNPENMVLPKELPSIMKLRPVSMEMSKYKPDYENIYSHETKGGEGVDGGSDNNNVVKSEPDDATTPAVNSPVPNGHIPVQTATPESQVSPVPNGNVPKPQNKPSPTTAKTPYRPSHRRQMSLGQEHTIFEEAEESIDSRVKLDPLMQSFPGATGPSLPVKNNFNLDYSYQLTYVQLAEHRRNKTIEELERRTGKRLSDLSADLEEHENRQSFERNGPGRVSSRSAGSAISSKKKKAPAPPGAPPPMVPGSSSTLPLPGKTGKKSPRQEYSVENEPPVDYDMDSPRRPPPPVTQPQQFRLPRYSPARPLSGPAHIPAPPPPPAPNSTPRRQIPLVSRSESFKETPHLILKKTPEYKQTPKPETESNGQVPWLLEIKNLSEAKAARRQQSQEFSQESTESVSTEADAEVKEPKTDVQKESSANLVFESDISVDKDVNKTLERSNSLKESDKPPVSKVQRHSSTTTYDRLAAPKLERQVSEPSSPGNKDPVRRLSSLLQHDIKTAGSAKCVKLVKQTTPVPPKPKDPHTVFREQLQKAAAARDERAKAEGTIDDKLKKNGSNASFDLGEVVENDAGNKGRRNSDKSEPPEVLPKPPRYHKNVTINRNSNMYSKTQKVGSTSNGQSPNGPMANMQQVATSLDWTPEVDLDSDDNLSDREAVTSKKGASDGFKSTIVPNNMTNMKTKKKDRKGKKPNGYIQNEDKANKFGSVKKLKKSMHKSVMNAFGSISKASGKILRKQKAEDLETVDDAPKNWSLTAATNGNTGGGRASKYRVPSSYDYDDGSNSDEDDHAIEFRTNGHIESDESSEIEQVSPRAKRGQSPYKSGKSLDLSDEDDEHIRSPRYSDKKLKEKRSSKYDYESSLRRREEREYEERMLRARQAEDERRKQLEIELEMHKIREAETRERLKKLEEEHLQQKVANQLLQQQQQQQQHQQQHHPQQQHHHHPQQQQHLGMLTAPALPPASGYPGFNALPDPTQGQGSFTNVFGQQMPQNGYPQNFGLFPQTNPYMSTSIPGNMSYDLNDYMRMLGVQSPPTSQQMAFFLNNMTLTGQPMDRKSNPLLMDMYKPQFPTNNYAFSGLDTNSLKRQTYPNWVSSPNIATTQSVPNSGTVPINDFVASYNGANSSNSSNVDGDEASLKSNNPLYNSDDESDTKGLTVARVQVKDYRKIPARTESGKFMRKYASENFIPNKEAKGASDFSYQSSQNVSDTRDMQRQESISPTNSVSTVDSAITSMTMSVPSSPAQSVGAPGSPVAQRSANSTPSFRTVVDLTSPTAGSSTQILV